MGYYLMNGSFGIPLICTYFIFRFVYLSLLDVLSTFAISNGLSKFVFIKHLYTFFSVFIIYWKRCLIYHERWFVSQNFAGDSLIVFLKIYLRIILFSSYMQYWFNARPWSNRGRYLLICCLVFPGFYTALFITISVYFNFVDWLFSTLFAT